MLQTTIHHSIDCTGIGLHSGKTVTLRMRPAAADTGILFHVSGKQGVCTISPTPEVVIATGLATTLGNEHCAVSTVEHLLAALRGLEIDNVHIDIQGGEVPILDGSAMQFVTLIKEAGIEQLHKPRRVLRVKAAHSTSKGDAFIMAEPYEGFLVDYTIHFPHKTIGTQRLKLEITPESFATVAYARTFGFLKDVEAMRAHKLALGGSLENAVVLDDGGVLNEDGLRSQDEFVRHKLLDFIGDMAMLPLPLQGKFTVRCSGHALNNQLLRELVASKGTLLEEVTLHQKPLHRILEHKRQPRALHSAAASA